VNEYREGKVKSTPVRGVKENLKPVAHKQSEGRPIQRKAEGRSLRGIPARGEPEGLTPRFEAGVGDLMACLLKNEPAS
jgi:hypothetical protein